MTPAYDLLATKLLLPNDTEELALSLNGKKSRFVSNDWSIYANYLGLALKQQTNLHQRLAKRLPETFQWIENSFLNGDQQRAFRQLVQERASRLPLTS